MDVSLDNRVSEFIRLQISLLGLRILAEEVYIVLIEEPTRNEGGVAQYPQGHVNK